MDNEAHRMAAEANRPASNGKNADAATGQAVEGERVARFLRDNPDWLSQQAGLYECLSPPKRVWGEALADHMAAMIEAARRRSRSVLDAGRAGLGLTERVRAAVLALMRSDEPGDWIGVDLPRLLGIDAARLCVEDGGAAGHALPAGTVQRLLGPRDALLRAGGGEPGDAALLHGEAAGLALHEALLRVRIAGRAPALLALAARAPGVLDGADGALCFLAQALAARLERS